MVERAPAGRPAALVLELVDLIAARGFISLGVADIAAELNCSKSTLYAIAPSKEQLLVVVVRAFFKRATERIEESVDRRSTPVEQIHSYLTAVSVELASASPQFYADLEVFSPAGEIYQHNTQVAAARVADLVRQARPDADSSFLGAVAALTMASIHRGDIARETGLDDSAAYRALASLMVAGLSGDPRNPSSQTPHSQTPHSQRTSS